MILERERHRVRVISNQRYFRKPVSHTFHGRDIFAPVAAHLAAGVAASRMGKVIRDYINRGFGKPVCDEKGIWYGQVLHVDRFGNVVTSFRASDFPRLSVGAFAMKIGSSRIRALASNYEEGGRNRLFVIPGSAGYLEVSLQQASAAEKIGCGPGTEVQLKL
jgi:hypothetical protein